MSFAGSRRLMMSSTTAVLLIISVLQIWLCCEYPCQAGAIRILPGNGMAAKLIRESSKLGSMDKKSKEELFRKYFNATSFALNKTHTGFEESKRRVPSCPDPLHN
ncbi:CLAVATA3/ESR (CLE)-related protein 43 [Corylus avellana]|uniref:CLAVATA3/ESR (CLE)-related protein 43 n=1 Tax=Corylus avellana TaxID=13451 RepID=UPI001E21DEEB|nr:CLAVATA3/ESR (CLE)-related protein 43 [Corylus avellana]